MYFGIGREPNLSGIKFVVKNVQLNISETAILLVLWDFEVITSQFRSFVTGNLLYTERVSTMTSRINIEFKQFLVSLEKSLLASALSMILTRREELSRV